jgi:hypothetical protein
VAAGRGAVRGDDVSNGLLDSSRQFAQSAIAAYTSENWPIFTLHLATAVELLVKGALSHVNPAFIADGRDFDSLLHLTGMPERARVPEFVSAVKSITAKEGFNRLAQLIDGYTAHSRSIDTLFERRNAVAHTGVLVPGQDEAIVGDVARYVPQVLRFVGRDEEGYWGAAAELVADHAKRRLGEVEASYWRRVAAAREAYRVWSEALETGHLEAVLAVLMPVAPASDFSAFPIECPACGNHGLLSGDPEPDWEADYDYGDGMTYIAGVYVEAVILKGSSFSCPVCHLILDDGLEFAGFDAVRFTDFDTEHANTFFSEPDEDPYDW